MSVDAGLKFVVVVGVVELTEVVGLRFSVDLDLSLFIDECGDVTEVEVEKVATSSSLTFKSLSSSLSLSGSNWYE